MFVLIIASYVSPASSSTSVSVYSSRTSTPASPATVSASPALNCGSVNTTGTPSSSIVRTTSATPRLPGPPPRPPTPHRHPCVLVRPHALRPRAAAGLRLRVLQHHADQLEPVSLSEMRESVVKRDQLPPLLRYSLDPFSYVPVEFLQLRQILRGTRLVLLRPLGVDLGQRIAGAPPVMAPLWHHH